MNRKMIAMVLVMMLCLTSAVAFAAPSKTTSNVVSTKPTTETKATIVVVEPTAASEAELDSIASFVNDGKPVVEYFGEDIAQEIATALPNVTDMSTMKLDEFFPITYVGTGTPGSATITLNTAATYKETDNVAVLGGIVTSNGTEWKLMPSSIVEGKIQVTLDAAFTALLKTNEAFLAVLSDAK